MSRPLISNQYLPIFTCGLKNTFEVDYRLLNRRALGVALSAIAAVGLAWLAFSASAAVFTAFAGAGLGTAVVLIDRAITYKTADENALRCCIASERVEEDPIALRRVQENPILLKELIDFSLERDRVRFFNPLPPLEVYKKVITIELFQRYYQHNTDHFVELLLHPEYFEHLLSIGIYPGELLSQIRHYSILMSLTWDCIDLEVGLSLLKRGGISLDTRNYKGRTLPCELIRNKVLHQLLPNQTEERVNLVIKKLIQEGVRPFIFEMEFELWEEAQRILAILSQRS